MISEHDLACATKKCSVLIPTAAWIKLDILTYLLKSAVLRKPCHRNFRKFQRSGESRFGGSKKDR